MRWFNLLALLSVGALFGGAYLLGDRPNLFGLAPGVRTVFDDTHYQVTHRAYTRRLMVLAFVIGLLFTAILTLSPKRLRRVGAAATILSIAGVAISVWPQHLWSSTAMPRRYIDYPDAFELWNRISLLGLLIALCAGAVLIVLVLVTLWRRLFPRPA